VTRRRVIARGHVQGVFFRDSVRRLADQHGVAGWVANQPDGSVEAVFEGDPGSVGRLVEFCRSGPRGAHVESLEEIEETPTGERGFTVR
jgi:acylphosphatase